MSVLGGVGAYASERLTASDDEGLIRALTFGDDSRLVVDPHTGCNRYLVPPVPAPDIACLSSCTASPISVAGFASARVCFRDVAGTLSACEAARRLSRHEADVKQRLLRHFGVEGAAEVALTQSGTHALLYAALLLAARHAGEPITAILPAAAETGTGVPFAAACRSFDGPADRRVRLWDSPVEVVHIPLRRFDGSPRPEDEVNTAFASAAATASGRPVIYATYGSKTGLIAPTDLPAGVDVVVDACQTRIHPRAVARCIARGWPVVVTGSKALGGPPFSGAVLFPRCRLSVSGAIERAVGEIVGPSIVDDVRARWSQLGLVLRWVAALPGLDAASMPAPAWWQLVRERGAAIEAGIAANPALVPVPGLAPGLSALSGLPTIFTFAVRDPTDDRLLLSTARLRPYYEAIAARGVLLGQPIDLGAYGGMRVAIGVRDVLEDATGALLGRALAVLGELTAGSGRRSMRREKDDAVTESMVGAHQHVGAASAGAGDGRAGRGGDA